MSDPKSTNSGGPFFRDPNSPSAEEEQQQDFFRGGIESQGGVVFSGLLFRA